MTAAGTVLVLAGRFDPTADLVVGELNRRAVPVFRTDLADFPLRLALAADFTGGAWHGTLRTERRTLDLRAVRSVYYRRPTRPRFPPDMSPDARRVAEREARRGFGGLLAALPARWLPPPGRAADAEYKPLQLRVAAEAGLTVPRTLITNDPAAARELARRWAGRWCTSRSRPCAGRSAGGRWRCTPASSAPSTCRIRTSPPRHTCSRSGCPRRTRCG
ncbi:MvdC/MvdD family ATP grasp protein [Streptomyces carminius]|uniref:MvdC/MvdD family ATP grasp protein n=1 Tax=Streptomyces carminius TaxID=2665496 RepID=UPI001E35A5D8|nr:hypothetical protein [Streptomyces carminius]